MFGSIYMIFTGISGLSNPEAVSQSMKKNMDQWESLFDQMTKSDPASQPKLEEIMTDISSASTSRNLRDNSFFILISNLLTFLGARWMLRLKKKGFHFYFLGTIIAVIAPLLVFGSDNFLGFSYALFAGVTGGLFIILYALKIKYMH
jgi:hypothetical protein